MIKLKDIALDNVAGMETEIFDHERREFVKTNILPDFSDPGIYPIFYVVEDYKACCPDCANKAEQRQEWFDYGERITGAAVNWENTDLYCDFCKKRIESAYAEEEEENA